MGTWKNFGVPRRNQGIPERHLVVLGRYLEIYVESIWGTWKASVGTWKVYWIICKQLGIPRLHSAHLLALIVEAQNPLLDIL